MGRERQMQKNAEIRQAIIDAAVSIGLEEGFEDLSIRKITDRLGYSAGIVYHYFRDKQEILDTIHNSTSMELKRIVEACAKKEYGFRKNIKVVFKMLGELSAYEPDMFRLILMDRYSPNNETIQTWLDMIRQFIDSGIETGELRQIDSELVSYTLLSTFLAAQMIIETKKLDKSKIEDIFDTQLDIILNGILK